MKRKCGTEPIQSVESTKSLGYDHLGRRLLVKILRQPVSYSHKRLRKVVDKSAKAVRLGRPFKRSTGQTIKSGCILGFGAGDDNFTAVGQLG